MINNLTSNQ